MARRTQDVDVSAHSDTVEAALTAFASDPTYATQMAANASTINHKRRVWQIRLALRKAEKQARKDCKSAGVEAKCDVESPCGTGMCPYAVSPFDQYATYAPGKTKRPRPSDYPYSLEQAVTELANEPLFDVSEDDGH